MRTCILFHTEIILLKLIIVKTLVIFLSVYAPQLGLPEPGMKHFYNQLQYTVAKVPAIEILIPVGDWNGHVGALAGVLIDAHGGHGFGTHNTEGERILKFAIAIGNIWYKRHTPDHIQLQWQLNPDRIHSLS